jgi:putative redox protein
MRLRAGPDGESPAAKEAYEQEPMSLTATARSIPETLRQEVVIDGKHRLITDEPERLGGDGSGPAPHELLPAALASCISTTLVMYARTKQWELGEVYVAVEYDNRSVPRRFDVHVEVGGELTDEQLHRLEKVAESCPVRRSIEAEMEFVETVARARRLGRADVPDSVAAGLKS